MTARPRPGRRVVPGTLRTRVTAVAALYLNCFVGVIQSFIKIPALHARAPTIPPAGPVFGAVQGVLLIAFIIAGWKAVRAGRGLAAAPPV